MAAQAALIPHAGNVPTFQTTTESYLTHGGEGRYLPPIVEYFADTPITAITPFDVKQMALALYPDCLNSTRNRQALTPARAVLFHGYERGWCHAMRLRSFKEDAPRRKSPASPVWLHIFCRQADADGLQRLSALVLFMAQTGARVSEAVALRWREVDFNGRKALLLKTKTEINSMRHLTDEVVSRLRALAGTMDPDDRVQRVNCREATHPENPWRLKGLRCASGLRKRPLERDNCLTKQTTRHYLVGGLGTSQALASTKHNLDR
jgi:integrase